MTDLKKEGTASQPVISIDSLAPAAIERKSESIGVTKNALTLSRLIPLALAAGFFIGLGGLYFTLFMADSSLSFAVQRFAGALMFSLGLALVIICGAELFTGNSLMIGALASRKIPVGGMLRNWIWVWIFNLVGAVILVTLVYLSDTPKDGSHNDEDCGRQGVAWLGDTLLQRHSLQRARVPRGLDGIRGSLGS